MFALLPGLDSNPDTFHEVSHGALRNLRRSLLYAYDNGHECPPCVPEAVPYVRDTTHAPALSPWYCIPSVHT